MLSFRQWKQLKMFLDMYQGINCATIHEYVLEPRKTGWTIERTLTNCPEEMLCYVAQNRTQRHEGCMPFEVPFDYDAAEIMDKAFSHWEHPMHRGDEKDFIETMKDVNWRYNDLLLSRAMDVENAEARAREAVLESDRLRLKELCEETGAADCEAGNGNSED